MGWLFSTAWQSKAELVKHLTEGNGLETLAHSVRGNILWAVQKSSPLDGKAVVTFIACYTMASGKRQGQGWGYKDMDESMFPFYYTCPLKFFKLCLPPSPSAAEWREAVRKFHAKQAAKASMKKAIKSALKVGCKVRLIEGCSVKVPLTITSLKPLLGTPEGSLAFERFLIRPRLIAEVLPE
jgi:hypothetical protein